MFSPTIFYVQSMLPRLLLTTLFAACLAIPATAQIVLTEAHVRAMFNGAIETQEAENPEVLQHLVDRTGPGQTYDLTSATFAPTESYEVRTVTCSGEMAGCNDEHLNTANLIAQYYYADTTFVMFQRIDAEGASILGTATRYEVPDEEREYLEEYGIDPNIDSLTIAIRFEPGLFELPLPLTMGATWNTESEMKMMLVEADLDLYDDMAMTMERSSAVDGWGELITPHGSVAVLRYSTVSVTHTSVFGFEVSDTLRSISLVSADGLHAEIELGDDGEVIEVSYTRMSTSTSVADGSELPASVELHQNYPNPFNPTTTISFELASTENVSIRVYDMTGRLIDTIMEGRMQQGRHALSWHAGQQPSGTYMVRLETPTATVSRAMVLLK
jgi:hypothetical protein